MLLLISPKNVYATRRLLEEFAHASVAVQHFDVHELAAQDFNIDVSKFNTLYARQAYPHFTEVISLAREFIQAGKRVVDANIVKGIMMGKDVMYEELENAGISIPQTFPYPSSLLPYPHMLKWVYGFGGKQVYLVPDLVSEQKVASQYPAQELLIQELIRAKHEYKVITVGFESLPVVLRFETQQVAFRPNFYRFQVVQKEECAHIVELAERAARVLGRELSKIDILEDESGKLFVLEVNRWPSLENFEQYTGYNAIADFVTYLK